MALRTLVALVSILVHCGSSFAQKFAEDRREYARLLGVQDHGGASGPALVWLDLDTQVPLAGSIFKGHADTTLGRVDLLMWIALEARLINAPAGLSEVNPPLAENINTGQIVARRVIAQITVSNQPLLGEWMIVQRFTRDRSTSISFAHFLNKYDGPLPLADGSIHDTIIDWIDGIYDAVRDTGRVIWYGWVTCHQSCQKSFRDMQNICGADEAAWWACVEAPSPATGAAAICTTKTCMDAWLDYTDCCVENGNPIATP